MAALDSVVAFALLLYPTVLLSCLSNCYYYVYPQKRYKVFLVVVFYVCAYIVLVTRIIYFTGNILSWYPAGIDSYAIYQLVNQTHMIATFAKIAQGFF